MDLWLDVMVSSLFKGKSVVVWDFGGGEDFKMYCLDSGHRDLQW